MPRSPRWAIANGLYHVMNRGLEKRDIVVDDHDRRTWMRLFDRVAHRCEWRVFAHVLLDNHFHIFVRTPHANLSTGMHDLQSGYATCFNQRHQRSGYLYQGRFKSVLVEGEGHAWELSRYVHLNPYRAKLTSDPAAYLWSTYRYYLNPRGAPSWLDWQTVLGEFSSRESSSRVAYKRFVEAGIECPPKNPMRDAVDGWLLGGAEFVERMRTLADDSPPEPSDRSLTTDDVLRLVADAFGTTVEQILRRGRQTISREKRRSGYSVKPSTSQSPTFQPDLTWERVRFPKHSAAPSNAANKTQHLENKRTISGRRGQVVQSSIFAGNSLRWHHSHSAKIEL